MSKIEFTEALPGKCVEYGDLHSGEVFKVWGCEYMKLSTVLAYGTAVRLHDGHLEQVSDSELVQVAKSAKMEIEW